MTNKSLLLLYFSLCAIGLVSPAQLQAQIQLEDIMQGEKFIGFTPQNLRWSEDSQSLFFDWNPENELDRTPYMLDIKSEKIEKAKPQSLPYINTNGNYTQDKKQKVYVSDGSLMYWDGKTHRCLLRSPSLYISYPHFTQNETHIAFQMANNLFEWDIKNGSLEQLTDFRKGEKKDDKEEVSHKSWLKAQQEQLFEVLRNEQQQKDFAKAQKEAINPQKVEPFYIKNQNLDFVFRVPNNDYAIARFSQSPNGNYTKVPDFVSESGYTEDLNTRAKVGSPETSYELWLGNLATQEWKKVSAQDLEGIRDVPAYYADYERTVEKPEERAFIAHEPVFSPDGKEALITLRALDSKDRWIVRLDMDSARYELLDRQHNPAWIGGPGISNWNFSSGNIGWLPDGKSIYFQSETSGYSHLYTYQLAQKKKTALTSGNFEIHSARIAPDGKNWYIEANKSHPGQYHFYHLPLEGGELIAITEGEGYYEAYPSPDGKYLALRYSESNRPWELYLMRNKPGAKATQLTYSQSENFKKYEWQKPEIIQFEAEDGKKPYARLYKPKLEHKNGAAVIFVHGAGYLQNVHFGWSAYFREYMFHHLLLERGYTVLDIDYRASKGYGEAWRTAIARHMGGKDLSDHVDGAKFLVEKHGIDANRIGIYGGSYGGFITLMAMCQHPDVFKAGAALRAVTDWAHYNHPYTANILNTPLLDSIAYARSSPINFAEGLEGHLLICHGMIDTNVHFQDVVRFAQRLIELGKQDWEMAVYPKEDHGFKHPSSWTDEYRRILKLFEQHLKKP
ncbi:MAG: S9 family peptidase [Bernardetiaceae bacterium]|nr:S9 family peptidase [Bernardetiaceae bacterium]